MTDVHLLMYRQDGPAGTSADTLFGGAPSVGPDFAWPICASCSGAMMFLGQIRPTAADRLLLVFMCSNDPGMCDEWDADAGGNAVLTATSDGLRLADIPTEGDVVRPRYGAQVEPVTAKDYDAARSHWGEAHDGRQREVLGQLGGVASWLQGDETPTCTACNTPMTLAAQLETGPDYATEMNFGGGCGYVFDCGCGQGTPKFLWQG
jgi:hypothetical protein